MTKKDMKKMRARARAAQRRRKRKKHNVISPISIIGVLAVCLVSALLLSYGAAAGMDKEILVKLKVDDLSAIQGEERPLLTAKATCDGDKETILDKDTGYTIQDLVDELNRGTGYTLECDGDGSEEGEFPIKAELTSVITTPLYEEWFGKVKVDVEDGVFEVKNKYGEWDADKFKRWDGTYVTNDFITYHNETYYFGEDGKKETGWQTINSAKYLFDENGVMTVGWYKEDGTKYYFDETGMMTVGWLTLDEDKYYFDQDGKMLTGEQKIGVKKCVFSEDGVLESSEGGVDPDAPMVALTFDDGPGPRTAELLDVFAQYDARATFFMLGTQVEKYPDTVKKMAETGCELGNHSFDHTSLTKLDASGIQKQMSDTNEKMVSACGMKATVMRPPYGAINDIVKQNVGMPMILWSIDTLDWKTRNTQSTIDAVINNVKDGDIILMHDIHTQSIDAAIALIPKLQEAGFQLVTVSEMAEAKGINMENGVKYGFMAKSE
ncbi:MAG: polysaccharide deacetylase family protein [Bariatricus sp.]|nr:polysaccharide deacetylase family protein [Bariatricus sp.]